MASPLPAIYRREAGSKLVGCLVYVVAAPFVALMLALFVSLPLMLVLEGLGMSHERASIPFPVLLPLIGVGVAIWGYRDYRRRAALEVVIDRDGVTINVDARRSLVPFEEVASIRLVPTRDDYACILVTRAGRAVKIPPEVAPLHRIHEPLDATLIPEMMRGLDERIARGEAVTLGIPATRLVITMFRAILILPLATLMLIRFSTHRMGVQMVRHSWILVRQAWMGFRGGLIIERAGPRPASDPSVLPIPWDQLDLIQTGPIGLVLRSKEGRVLSLSSLADDFWPALRWIKARMG